MSGERSKLDQLLGASAAAAGEPERHAVTLTLLVVDVVGSAGYFDRQGGGAGAPSAGSGVLEQYERMGTRAVDGHGGRVVRILGDTLLAEFSDPTLAVQAAVHLQRRLAQLRMTLPQEDQIQLRMGLSQGPCFRAGSDLFGEGVERCAALCKRAGPAQILLSREMREAVAGHREIVCMWLGKFTVAEREEDLFEVVWTEAGEYAELRHHTTVALRRGDLMVPGLQLMELAQPEPSPAQTVIGGTAVPSDVVGQRTGEFVPLVPASLTKRYDIRGELGRGGMGVVYKAWDRETDEMVALKVLRGEIAADDTALVRFRNEVRTARRVTHKNVCRIHDFNRTEDAAYISMEYIEGRSLRALIAETDGLPLDKGLAIARQICAGLAEAHKQGIVHRDLKPENVMVDRENTVRLLDFGIARSVLGAGVTQTGAVMGTPAYMAPEQAEGIKIDHRADIYALGLILYEMFTGTPTFRAATPIAVVMKHMQEIPTPPRAFKPTLPEEIEQTILRCLAKKPDERFQSVAEVAAALESAVDEMPTQVGRDAPAPLRSADAGSPAASPYVPTQPVRTILPEEEKPAAASAAAPANKPAAPAVARPAQPRKANTWVVVAAVVVVAAGAALYFKPWAPREPAAQPGAVVTPASPQDSSGGKTPVAVTSAPTDLSGQDQKQPPNDGATPSGGEKGAGQPEGGATPAEKPRPNLPPPAPSLPPVSVSFSFVQSLGQVKGGVNGVALSPNGRLVATAGQDTTVGIWEAASGRQIQKMRGHTGAVLGVAFSRDGVRVASASADKTTRIWSAAAGNAETVLPKESAAVLRAAYSPDGQLLATSMGDGRIILWEAATGSPVQTLVGHSGPVYSIAFSGDGRILVSGGSDATVRVWNVTAGSERGTLRGNSGPVAAVAISTDGRMVAAAGNDGAVRVWETASGRQVFTLKAHSGSADAVIFGPDGRWLVSGGSDKAVRVWELPSGREVATLEKHFFGITDLALAAGGHWLASSDSGGTVMLWRWR